MNHVFVPLKRGFFFFFVVAMVYNNVIISYNVYYILDTLTLAEITRV